MTVSYKLIGFLLDPKDLYHENHRNSNNGNWHQTERKIKNNSSKH